MACLLGCLGFSIYLKRSNERVAAEKAAAVAKAEMYFETPFQEECEYIVDAIATDIAEMTYYAKNKTLPDAAKFSVTCNRPVIDKDHPLYDLKIAGLSAEPLLNRVDIDRPIWAPEVYQKLTTEIFAAAGVPASPGKNDAPDDSLIQHLLTLNAETLENEDEKLSRELADHFDDPALHEKAALLLGAFVLRDSSGWFFDIRSDLCRITAHLAMAKQLRGANPPGKDGELAEAILYTMMNNERDALERIAKLEEKYPDLAPWTRALRTRNMYDQRILWDVKDLTLLEKVQLFRAISESIETGTAWKKVYPLGMERIPDWTRITAFHDHSVSLGHQFAKIGLPLELNEIKEAYKIAHGSDPDFTQIADILNVPPERCVTRGPNNTAVVRVIGWGHWANFLQRHLCSMIERIHEFYQNEWGVPENAKEFSENCDKFYSKLRLYPFVCRLKATEQTEYKKSVDDGFKVTRATPHLTPAMCWNDLCMDVDFGPKYQPNPNPHINEWHSHNPPTGTAYDPWPRFNHPSLVSGDGAERRMDRVHEIAPYDPRIDIRMVRVRYKKNPTPEQVAELYRPIVDYNPSAMWRIAQTVEDKPDHYEMLLLKAIQWNPNCYFDLARYFRDTGNMEKALAYAQKGVEEGLDAVSMANEAKWIVKALYAAGKKDEALKLAQRAAEVYSYDGLAVNGWLMEHMGRYDEALDMYQKIEERYDSSEPLCSYYLRYKQRTNDTKFDEDLKAKLSKIFPHGFGKVDVTSLPPNPKEGLEVREENLTTRRNKIVRGDIIVALNGYPLENVDQYRVVILLDDNNKVSFTIWRGNAYVEVPAELPFQSLGVYLKPLGEKN